MINNVSAKNVLPLAPQAAPVYEPTVYEPTVYEPISRQHVYHYYDYDEKPVHEPTDYDEKNNGDYYAYAEQLTSAPTPTPTKFPSYVPFELPTPSTPKPMLDKIELPTKEPATALPAKEQRTSTPSASDPSTTSIPTVSLTTTPFVKVSLPELEFHFSNIIQEEEPHYYTNSIMDFINVTILSQEDAMRPDHLNLIVIISNEERRRRLGATSIVVIVKGDLYYYNLSSSDNPTTEEWTEVIHTYFTNDDGDEDLRNHLSLSQDVHLQVFFNKTTVGKEVIKKPLENEDENLLYLALGLVGLFLALAIAIGILCLQRGKLFKPSEDRNTRKKDNKNAFNTVKNITDFPSEVHVMTLTVIDEGNENASQHSLSFDREAVDTNDTSSEHSLSQMPIEFVNHIRLAALWFLWCIISPCKPSSTGSTSPTSFFSNSSFHFPSLFARIRVNKN